MWFVVATTKTGQPILVIGKHDQPEPAYAQARMLVNGADVLDLHLHVSVCNVLTTIDSDTGLVVD